MARRIVDSIAVNATGESHRGPSEINEDMDEEEMKTRYTKCNGLSYSLQGGTSCSSRRRFSWSSSLSRVCAACQRELSGGREGAAVFVKSDIEITHGQVCILCS